jgi:hypothetical protein
MELKYNSYNLDTQVSKAEFSPTLRYYPPEVNEPIVTLSPMQEKLIEKAMEERKRLTFPEIKEEDPSGKALNEPGAKADAGKNRVWLFLAGFSRALDKVSEVTTIGAKKYTPNGWSEVPDGYARYMDAFGRHLAAYGQGKKLDSGENGTGCEHIAQMIWNLLAAYELSLRESEKNK